MRKHRSIPVVVKFVDKILKPVLSEKVRIEHVKYSNWILDRVFFLNLEQQ